MRKLLGLLFNRWVLRILGLVALCLVIWLVGPAIQVFGRAPLETAWPRWTLIAVLCVAALARWAWAKVRAWRASAALSAGLARQAAPAGGARDEEAAVLSERFEAALRTLKQTDLSASRKGTLRRLRSLMSGSYLYELPWYVFIGAPGSGKTTALINSGLQFPLAERFGKDAIRGVAGTRNCDWWFTDQAVLLDTAGRYATQDSDKEVDAAGWKAFLALLKKARPRRPLNGVLLTVSVADLLQQSEAQREAQAQALRRRLQELYRDLNLRLPVYVLVTKADLLAGFNEYFATLGKEEREQVWGASLAYAEDGSGLAQLPQQLSALERRLSERLLARLHEETDAGRRAVAYVFPQQYAAASARLTELLEQVFAPSKYDVAPLLRGAYFTSGTQEGSPIDRVLGQVARGFGLERRLQPPHRASGRSYFLTRLLKEVIFPEAGLAGANLKWERRRAWLQLGAASAGIAVVGVASAAWAVSYSQNRGYLEAVASRLADVKQSVRALTHAAHPDLLSLLPALHSVDSLARTQAAAEEAVPWSMGFGLYQGHKLERATQAAYRQVLEATYLPALAQRLEEQMRAGFTGNPDLLYEALKAYVMMQDGKRFARDELQAWYALDFGALLPREASGEQRDALARHVGDLYQDGWVQPPSAADAALLAQVRAGLARTPLAQRIYARLRRQDVGKEFPDFSISAKVPGAELVFVRRGEALTKGIPGLYTFDAYHKAFADEAVKAAQRLAVEEAWVLAVAGSTLHEVNGGYSAQVADAVKRLYLEDYRQQWDGLLRSIGIVRKTELKDAVDLARLLSDPTPANPVKRLYAAVARETRLSRKPGNEKNLLDQAEDKARKTLDDLSRLVRATAQPPASAAVLSLEKQLVDDYFAELHEFVGTGEATQPAPIDAALALLAEAHGWLATVERAQREKLPPPQSPTPDKLLAEGARYPEPLRSMIAALRSDGLAGGGTAYRQRLNQLLKAEVTDFCLRALSGRYPFQRGSGSDVTQEDFNRLFAPGGVIDGFFQRNLASLVDTSSASWSFRQADEMGRGADLAQFQKAAVIRDVFFRAGGNGPALRFELRPLEMDDSIQQFTLDVDGQLVRYAHGPQVPTAVQFPGPRGSRQVRVTISPAAPSGTSGLVFDGPWALFRLFDGVHIESTGQRERFRASISIEGRKTVFEVFASSVQNPFRMPELIGFRCPSTL
jgi:type VI secretion system protein ImpL